MAAASRKEPSVGLRHGRAGSRRRRYSWPVTTREKLHRLVDELNEAEVEAALARLVREREALEHWTEAGDSPSAEDSWALANAREAIREEPW